MANIQGPPEENKDNTGPVDPNKQKTMKVVGTTDASDLLKDFETDENSIQLINISEDPNINNCLIYYIPSGDSTLGKDPKCLIQLEGLGMMANHAKFKVAKDYSAISVETIDGSKIIINGN
jgi:hypothetical protein